MDLSAVGDRLRQDYANFPKQQSYDLYAEDVLFQDPLNRFHGVDRYRQMIAFIDRWFQHPHLQLHSLEQTAPDALKTRWTLSWITPLPWKPPIAISGWTDYRFNQAGQIIAHIDYWDCSRLAVLGQVFGIGTPSRSDIPT
jgi:hypothetical protein